MRTRLLLFALLSVGCQPVEQNFNTAYGATVYDESGTGHMTKEYADDMEAWLVKYLPAFGYEPGFIQRSIKGASIQVVEGFRPCTTDPKTLCAGEQTGTGIWITDSDCPWNTAFRHELLHLIQMHIAVFDYEHSRPEWQHVMDASRDCSAPVYP